MHSSLKNCFLCLLAIAILSCTTTPVQQSDEDTIISFEKTVHFLSLAGEDITVQPGLYQIMRSGNDSMWFTGEDPSNPILIAAHERINKESVSQPEVLSIVEREDELHLVLLLPEGKGLEAVGSFTDIRSKGASPPGQISSSQISQSLQRRLHSLQGRLLGLVSFPISLKLFLPLLLGWS